MGLNSTQNNLFYQLAVDISRSYNHSRQKILLLVGTCHSHHSFVYLDILSRIFQASRLLSGFVRKIGLFRVFGIDMIRLILAPRNQSLNPKSIQFCWEVAKGSMLRVVLVCSSSGLALNDVFGTKSKVWVSYHLKSDVNHCCLLVVSKLLPPQNSFPRIYAPESRYCYCLQWTFPSRNHSCSR